MARRNQRYTRRNSYTAHQKRVEQRQDDAVRFYQARKRQKKLRYITAVNRAIHSEPLTHLQRERIIARTSPTVITRNRLFNQVKNIPTRFYPVSFARITKPFNCKRAKTAERHNVMKKIKTLGAGSIAKRTLNRALCNA